MDSSELPAGPIGVDEDALVAIDPDPADASVPNRVVAGLNRQYTQARAEVTAARQRHNERKRFATEADDPATRGEQDGLALLARRDWIHWLGAVSALERLADELQVELDDDRRPYLRPEDRT